MPERSVTLEIARVNSIYRHIVAYLLKALASLKRRMMISQIDIENFVAEVRKMALSTQVSFNLFVDCEEFIVEAKFRTAEDLKNAGISMRNLKGEFIK